MGEERGDRNREEGREEGQKKRMEGGKTTLVTNGQRSKEITYFLYLASCYQAPLSS
jgi:hypothetical protein